MLYIYFEIKRACMVAKICLVNCVRRSTKIINQYSLYIFSNQARMYIKYYITSIWLLGTVINLVDQKINKIPHLKLNFLTSNCI